MTTAYSENSLCISAHINKETCLNIHIHDMCVLNFYKILIKLDITISQAFISYFYILISSLIILLKAFCSFSSLPPFLQDPFPLLSLHIFCPLLFIFLIHQTQFVLFIHSWFCDQCTGATQLIETDSPLPNNYPFPDLSSTVIPEPWEEVVWYWCPI